MKVENSGVCYLRGVIASDGSPKVLLLSMLRLFRLLAAQNAVEGPAASILKMATIEEVAMQSLDLGRLRQVWARICKDPDGRRALAKLEHDGFNIAHLCPRDPTLQNPSCADLIAALPFLPNRLTRTQLHRRTEVRKYHPLIFLLRRLAQRMDDPFCAVELLNPKGRTPDEKNIPKRLRETAEFLEHFLSWDWSMRERNARNTVIAKLRDEIRTRTGRPHDAELNLLVDAAFRAAGRGEGWHRNPSALDRIENRELEGRFKATWRLHSPAVRSDDFKQPPSISRVSLRNRKS